MSRGALSPVLVLSLFFLFLAQAKASTVNMSSPVQVVYVLDGSTLTTYDVDSQTLDATQVGSLSLTQYLSPGLTTSPNGHFMYYTDFGFTPNTGNKLWVYATDATGSPQNPPVQELDGTYLWGLPQFDPKANFAYVFSAVTNKADYTQYTIWRYVFNPSSGKLSQKQSVASYYLFSDPSSNDCAPAIMGFSTDGTEFYDEIMCFGPYNASSAAYNERTVDLQTGALGPDQRVYSWQNGDAGGGEFVEFVNNLVFDFVTPNDFQQGIQMVDIYPLKPHTTTPVIQCGATMLEACGYSSGVAHPSGEYVFMQVSSDNTQIDKVELAQQQIVDTGNYIPFEFGTFSPDGTIVYADQPLNTSAYVDIYGFNIETSNITPGGVIYLPSNLDEYFVAERY